MCDIILASPTAVFGQPEVNIGVIPGGGGTQVRPLSPRLPPSPYSPIYQRLARAIGKSRTMELTLTGRNFTAAEAASWGLVSRVSEDVLTDALDTASTIASKSAIAVQAGKEAVNAAYEGTLAEGLRYERRLFHGLFATHDQKEGACALKFEECRLRWLTLCVRRNGCVCREAQADVEALVKRSRGLSITTCTTDIATGVCGFREIMCLRQNYLENHSQHYTR